MAVNRSIYSFAIIAIVMQVFFAIIYGFHQGYATQTTFADANGLVVAIYLVMLLLIGFGLVSTYLKESAITGVTLNFIMLAFTIQWYFLIKKFWYSINIADHINMVKLGDNPMNIRLSPQLHINASGKDIIDMQWFTLSQAIACAIAMFIILWPLLGRVGPGEALIIVFLGNIGYTLNEAVFWRLNIQDNGYGMKIFLFGSFAGLIASLIVGGRRKTAQHQRYYSSYNYQALGLVGAVFVWVLLPWLSVIDQSQLTSAANLLIPDFRQVAPINVILASCASACGAFAMSILLRGKISVHSIVFSCFSGAIAYGSSSNVFPNPFPAMTTGFVTGILVTILNGQVKRMNQNGTIDSLGGVFAFLVPSVIGAIVSAILFATAPYDSQNKEMYIQVPAGRDRWGQGGFQLIGFLVVAAIAAATGLLIGFINSCIASDDDYDLFNDNAYIEQDSESKINQQTVQVQ